MLFIAASALVILVTMSIIILSLPNKENDK
jgi:hypothetical protein